MNLRNKTAMTFACLALSAAGAGSALAQTSDSTTTDDVGQSSSLHSGLQQNQMSTTQGSGALSTNQTATKGASHVRTNSISQRDNSMSTDRDSNMHSGLEQNQMSTTRDRDALTTDQTATKGSSGLGHNEMSSHGTHAMQSHTRANTMGNSLSDDGKPANDMPAGEGENGTGS